VCCFTFFFASFLRCYSPYFGDTGVVVLAVAMPPDAGCARAQAMSGVAVSVVEEELLADRLFKETVFTCSW
jgi:hypothetical protein